MTNPDKQRSLIVAIVLLIAAVALLSLQFVSNIASIIRRASLKVEHPKESTFVELDNLLAANVKDGRVNYAQLKNSALLAQTVARLETFSPDQIENKSDQLCFWINAYNLLVVKEIADRFPITNVRQLARDEMHKKFLVGGVPYSVQNLYSEELIPRLKSGLPIAAFVVCGGAIGHPQLLAHTLKASSLKNDCEEAAKQFIGNSANLSYNAKDNVYLLSPWFQWQELVFKKAYRSSQDLIALYLDPEQRKVYKQATARSFGKKFDWRINNQKSEK